MATCTNPKTKVGENIDWQGHRGARAVYPENTVPAFKYALETGVKTLEMDVVITADSMVVLSHEPFMNHEICLDSKGDSISVYEEKHHNINQMTYEQVKQYDCGSKKYLRFPEQKKMKVAKPLLAQVIMTSESIADQHKREKPFYNIEIKSRPEWDSIFHPEVGIYADLVMEVIDAYQVRERTIIQSFDKRALQYVHWQYPDVKLALLVEENPDFKAEIKQLGFVPDVYSCYYPLVDSNMVNYCQANDIQVIPWTVNTKMAVTDLINLGVDGIITDKPALMKEF